MKYIQEEREDLFQTHIRLPKIKQAKLKALAKEKDRSLNWLVSQFVLEKLEEFDEQMKGKQ